MDAEHRVEGQEGMSGTPEGGPSPSHPEAAAPGEGGGEARPEGSGEGGGPEHRAEGEGGGPGPEHRAEGQGEGQGPGPEAQARGEGGGPTESPREEGSSGEASGAVEPPRSEAGEEARAEGAPAPGEVEPVPAEPRRVGRVTTVALSLEKLADDTTFQLRPEGDVSGLATDLARLGQLFPVDVRPLGEDRYQLVCGFRRVAALRFLKRDQVQARVHEELSDEDALLLSLAEAIHASPVEPEVLEAKRDALEAEGRLTAPVRDMLEKALATEETLAPEGVEEEVDADELASDVAQRMGALNQDLSLLADVFAALDESRKAELLMQLRYSAELVAYLEGL